MVDKRKQGRSNKRKGYYYEAKALKMAEAHGLEGKRQWGSGRVPQLPHDLVVEGEYYEVKSRKGGFGFDDILNDPTIAGLITINTGQRGQAPLVRLKWDHYLLLKAALKGCEADIKRLQQTVASQAMERDVLRGLNERLAAKLDEVLDDKA